MRIELRDINGYYYRCDTTSAQMAAAWIGEHLPAMALAGATYNLPWQLSITPCDHAEAEQFRTQQTIHARMDREGLEALSALFAGAAERTSSP